jgi:allophanate hydrolase subunit 2
VLGAIGPEPLAAGDLIPIGTETTGEPAPVEPPPIPVGAITVGVLPGPRAADFPAAAWEALLGSAYAVTPDSNRIALRLAGPPVPTLGEVEPEGLVDGAIQVPPDGQPIVFLADHPVTGGYPVLAVVSDHDLRHLAQARPGLPVRFRATD